MAIESTLVGCDKRSTSDYIKSLALKVSAVPYAKRLNFRSIVITGLYGFNQTIVDAKAKSLGRRSATNQDIYTRKRYNHLMSIAAVFGEQRASTYSMHPATIS
jgi:hypothetical protein